MYYCMESMNIPHHLGIALHEPVERVGLSDSLMEWTLTHSYHKHICTYCTKHEDIQLHNAHIHKQ